MTTRWARAGDFVRIEQLSATDGRGRYAFVHEHMTWEMGYGRPDEYRVGIHHVNGTGSGNGPLSSMGLRPISDDERRDLTLELWRDRDALKKRVRELEAKVTKLKKRRRKGKR